MGSKTAIAIAAHPDDIEFGMAGTLLLLGKAGYELHYFNLARGNCGSNRHNAAVTRSIRKREARTAAKILGAQFHPAIADDLEIVYSVDLLRRVASVLREVRPAIVLTHSPQDYMEDHTNTCRLAVTAAFAHGMPNFDATPRRPAADYEITVYHGMPHGLRDGLRRLVVPGAFVNIASVLETKQQALAQHRSQQPWLGESQGLNSYLIAMKDMAAEVGRLSKRFKLAEGWRRHSHLGFCAPGSDPLAQALGRDYLINRRYEKELDSGQPRDR